MLLSSVLFEDKMTLSEWLQQEHGRAAALARQCGVTRWAVSQWASTGVPKARMADIRDMTAGHVSLEEMVEQAPARERKGSR